MIKTIDVIPCSSTNKNKINRAQELPSRLKAVSNNSIRIKEGAVYHSSIKYIGVVCMKCSHQWETSPNNLVNNRAGCPECAKQNVRNSAGTRQHKKADRATKLRAAELRAQGWTYEAIADELGYCKSTIRYWLDESFRKHSIKLASESQKKRTASGRLAEIGYHKTPQGKAASKKNEHKRRSLKYHAVDAVYLPEHPEADYQGFVAVDMWKHITKEDYDFWSFDGANEDVAKRTKQQQGLEKISGEKYSLEHLIPLSRGGLHHPMNFANRALALNIQKRNQMLPDDVKLFAKRLFN